MTHQDRVLQYMKDFGSITTFEAFREFGNTRLSSSIFCLKKKGYNIKSEMETNKNRYGDSTTYARYSLIKEDEKLN